MLHAWVAHVLHLCRVLGASQQREVVWCGPELMSGRYKRCRIAVDWESTVVIGFGLVAIACGKSTLKPMLLSQPIATQFKSSTTDQGSWRRSLAGSKSCLMPHWWWWCSQKRMS